MLPDVPLPKQPEDPEDSFVLGVVEDYLKNGGKVPNHEDLRLMLRLNLAATRATYRQSHRNHNNIVAQWLTLGGVVAAGIVQALLTTEAHKYIWAAINVLQLAGR